MMRSIRQKSIKYILAVFTLLCLVFNTLNAYADTATYKNWNEVASAMEEHILNGANIYREGGSEKANEAKDAINTAYYKFYEKLGFEKTVMASISGSRGSDVEHQFYLAKKAISDAKSPDEVDEEVQKLIQMLHEDADTLDGVSSADKEGGADASGAADKSTDTATDAGAQAKTNKQGQDFVTFMAAFGLTLREGLEAILVIAAIIAYLVKTDNKKHLKAVYVGAIAGIVISIVLAIGFNMIAASIGEAQSGASQEIFEGITMFIATAVLFYVSNWMLSKSETEVWNKYIKDQVDSSITKGNVYTLVFTSFLAVSREGAELILFFQGMRSNIANSPYHMWLGLGIAIVVLVFVYILITKLSIRLPLKPFFMATSILMFILCISFVGKGVFELQEADVIGRTPIPAMNGFTIDFLGIYDRVENLAAQFIILIITVISVVMHTQNTKKIKAELEQKNKK